MIRTLAVRRQAGNTFVGFIVGLVCGLVIAVVVALFITKAPVPFVNKGNGKTPESTPIAGAQTPDPNKPFYPKETPPAAQSGAQPGMPAAAPTPGAEPDKKLSFYDLAPAKPADAAKPSNADTGKPGSGAAPADDGKQYLLQAGAFKSVSEAQAMKARLALMGFNAAVSTADKDGTTLYRVRIGPLAKLDELNHARQLLAQNGVDAAVVPVR